MEIKFGNGSKIESIETSSAEDNLRGASAPVFLQEAGPLELTKFVCTKDHTFFLPIQLPISLEEFADIITGLACPRCGLKGNDVSIIAKQYNAYEQD